MKTRSVYLLVLLLAFLSIFFAQYRILPDRIETPSNELLAYHVDCTVYNEECIEKQARVLAKAWSWRPLTPNHCGITLVKVPKSASSTITGSLIRVANDRNCTIEWKHRLAHEMEWNDEDFHIAPIRQADTRALSSIYYHQVSLNGRQRIRDEEVIRSLNTTSNYILEYTALAKRDDWASELYPASPIRNVMEKYDFLIIVERMSESLVALSCILDVPLTSLLTVASKTGGTWYLAGKQCVKLVKPVTTPTISDYMESKWRHQNLGDYLLYSTANRSLDLTLEALGSKRVEKGLSEYARWHSRLQKCSNEVLFPCSQEGVPQLELSKESCYVRDFGCGHKCIDRLLAEDSLS